MPNRHFWKLFKKNYSNMNRFVDFKVIFIAVIDLKIFEVV